MTCNFLWYELFREYSFDSLSFPRARRATSGDSKSRYREVWSVIRGLPRRCGGNNTISNSNQWIGRRGWLDRHNIQARAAKSPGVSLGEIGNAKSDMG